MKGINSRFTSALLAFAMLLNLPQLTANAQVSVLDSGYQTPSYSDSAVTTVWSTSYKDALNTATAWREGMVTGNGESGVIETCSPTNDILIYQNTKFNMPNNDIMDTPELASVLPQVRQASLSLVEGAPWKIVNDQIVKDWQDKTWDTKASKPTTAPYGYDYTFHPGPEMNMKIPASGNVTDYKRWTNYETAEVGVQYSDDKSDNLRRTFASRKDNVVITYITKSPKAGEENDSNDPDTKINMTLSFDDIGNGFSESTGAIPKITDKVLVPDDASYIAMVGRYPDFPNSILPNSGYAGVTKVITVGGTKTRVSQPVTAGADKITRNVGTDNPSVQISGADAVILITKLDRQVGDQDQDPDQAHADGEKRADGGMGTADDFKNAADYPLVDRLLSDTATIETKYTQSESFDYNAALDAHKTLHQTEYDRVKVNLNGDFADRALSNEELLAKQRNNPSSLIKALLERAYNSGRYADICATGYSTSRLGGMWQGVWNAYWQADYTTDANVNLQVSGVNTGNMKEASQGFINFVLRNAVDWDYNAKQIHGMDDAIMANGRTDGENGFIYHINAGNPFMYWNAGTDWLLLPIYEYWQCYGDQQIPVGPDVSVKRLQKVLSLTGADVARIEQDGYFDLEKDILMPLLIKSANFWKNFVDPHYYVDKNGKASYDANHTALADGEKYLFLPTYSPENHPTKPYEDVIQLNATMDIAAAHDALDMVTAMEESVKGSADPKWMDLKSKLPDYNYHSNTGDLSEWALDIYGENYGHRHLSYLYSVWPGYEAETNPELFKGAQIAMAYKALNNSITNLQSHGWMHKGLVEARLKNGQGVVDALSAVLTNKIYYSSMMTNHNADGSSTYCTDTEITVPNIINESLCFSNTGTIQILPALPQDWDKGSISGLMARTNAEVKNLSWDRNNGTATVIIRSNADQTINLKCGITWEDADVQGAANAIVNKNESIALTMNAGQEATIFFKLPTFMTGSYTLSNGNKYVTVDTANASAAMGEGTKIVAANFRTAVPESAQWLECPQQVKTADPKNPWKYPGIYYGYYSAVSTQYAWSLKNTNNAITGATEFDCGKGTTPIVNAGALTQFKLTDTGDGDGSIYIETFKSWTGTWAAPYAQKVLGIDSTTDYVVAEPKDTADNSQKWFKAKLGNGYTVFENKANSEYLNSISYTVTTPVNTIEATGISSEQTWNIIPQGNNQFQFVNVNSGRSLSVKNGSVVQSETGDNWTFVSDGQGYKLETSGGTKALSISNGTISLSDASEGTSFLIDRTTDQKPTRLVDSISITGSSTIPVGSSTTLGRSINPISLATTNVDGVAWFETDGTGSATIDNTGKVSATKAGTVTVSAVSVSSPNVIATRNITVTPVDKTALQQLIDANKNRKATDYTSDSWQAFQTALTAAQAVVSDDSALNAAIQTVYSNLTTAIDGLKPNKSALQKLYDDSKSRNGNYTYASWQSFQVALNAAAAVLNADSADSNAIQKAYNDLQAAVNSLVISSSHSSGGTSSGNTSPSNTNPTTTTTSDTASGTVVNVTTQPDTAPVVTGNTSVVNVTVPADQVTSVIASASAAKPAEVKVSTPTLSILDQLKNTAVKSVNLTIHVPTAIANNTNANVQVSINVEPAALQAAKAANKDISIEVVDVETGRQAYSWTFSGSNLNNSAADISNVNLAVSVVSANSNAVAAAVTAANTPDKKVSGIILRFANNGLLPAPASVRVYVGDQAGVTPGTKMYLYYLSSATKVLEQLSRAEYTVDSQCYLTVSIPHCSDYVLLPKPAINAYPVQSDTTSAVGVRNGKTYTYALTVTGNAVPSFSVGNGKAFSTTVKRVSNKYYFTVKAIGTAGTMTAVYSTLPGQKPVIQGYIAVTK